MGQVGQTVVQVIKKRAAGGTEQLVPVVVTQPGQEGTVSPVPCQEGAGSSMASSQLESTHTKP